MHRRWAISVVVYLAALAQTAIVSAYFFFNLRSGDSTIFSILRFAEWLPLMAGLFCLAAFLLPSAMRKGPVLEKMPAFWPRMFSLLAFFLSPFVSWVVKMEMYGVAMIPTKAHLYMQCMGLLSILFVVFLQVAYCRAFSQLKTPRPKWFARLCLAMPLYLTVVPLFAVLAGAFYLTLFAGEEGSHFRMIPNLLWLLLEKGSADRANEIFELIIGSIIFQYAAMLPYLVKHGFSENNAIAAGDAETMNSANAPCVCDSVSETISLGTCGDCECPAQPAEQEYSNEEDSVNQRP
ncbi:MAG: hypothetical protein MJ106_07830 [Lentisphaeria bacterium]|nr:hypothetical protein [Lentisphaeria bacterium]